MRSTQDTSTPIKVVGEGVGIGVGEAVGAVVKEGETSKGGRVRSRRGRKAR